jgi:hypothetical protein
MKSLLRFPWLYVLEAVLWLPVTGGAMSVLSFLNAESAAELLAKGKAIPPGWEAAVRNHGFYYEWHLISTHVFHFIASLVVAVGAAIAISLIRKTEHALLKAADPQIKKWHVLANVLVTLVVVGVSYLFVVKIFV